jgi:hypothetical protein
MYLLGTLPKCLNFWFQTLYKTSVLIAIQLILHGISLATVHVVIMGTLLSCTYTVTGCLCIQLQSKLQSQKNADWQL